MVLDVRPLLNATLADLPEWATVVLMKDSSILHKYEYFLDMQDYLGDLQDIKNPIEEGSPLNVWVLGAAGSGKTSFIMTLATLISNASAPCYSGYQIGGNDDHVTSKISSNCLDDHLTSEISGSRLGCPIQFYDAWGIDNSNYTDLTLEMMVSTWGNGRECMRFA